MKKVYCKDCAFILRGPSSFACASDNNQIIQTKDNWYDKNKTIIYKEPPSIKNGNNDCKEYRERRGIKMI